MSGVNAGVCPLFRSCRDDPAVDTEGDRAAVRFLERGTRVDSGFAKDSSRAIRDIPRSAATPTVRVAAREFRRMFTRWLTTPNWPMY